MDTVYLVIGKILVWGVAWVVANLVITYILVSFSERVTDILNVDVGAFEWTEWTLNTTSIPYRSLCRRIGIGSHEAEDCLVAVCGAPLSVLMFASGIIEATCIHPIRRRVRARRASAAAPPAASA